MEKDSKKVNFFNRIKKSVFKLEDYSDFLEEKFSVSIKYFLLLILLITVLISVVQAVIFTKKINKGYEYFVNELPEFEYKDEKLVFSNNVDAYDEEFKDIFHKQSWYFRQDMGRQSTIYKNFQIPFLYRLPKSESHYKTQ